MTKSLAEFEIERLPWTQLREASGSAKNIPAALMELFKAELPDDAGKAYWKLENHVVVQGQVFESAEFVVSVLLAALLDERPRHVRISILELLFQIVNGSAHESEMSFGNVNLIARCKENARNGLWVLYRELMQGEKDGAQEVIEIIENEPMRLSAFLANL